MSNQIFKKDIPLKILFDLLDKTCNITETHYILDINAYKKMLFHEYHVGFLSQVAEYYHNSKKYYVERECTYNSFMTIVRQICKYNTVQFTSKIKYNSSKYNIEYLIYI
jgi:hypothetical protein